MPADHKENPPSDRSLSTEDFSDEHSQHVLTASARVLARELGRQAFHELAESVLPPAGTAPFPAGR